MTNALTQTRFPTQTLSRTQTLCRTQTVLRTALTLLLISASTAEAQQPAGPGGGAPPRGGTPPATDVRGIKKAQKLREKLSENARDVIREERRTALRAELNWSDDRIALVEKVLASHDEERLAIMRSVREARKKLKDFANDPKSPPTAINLALDDLDAARARKDALQAKQATELRAALSPIESAQIVSVLPAVMLRTKQALKGRIRADLRNSPRDAPRDADRPRKKPRADLSPEDADAAERAADSLDDGSEFF